MKDLWKMKKVQSVDESEKDDEEDTKKEIKIVEIVDNHIYFYSEIERDKILQLNKKLRELDNNNISTKYKKNLDRLDKIFLYINSYGGSIFSGFSAMDNILQCKSDVNTVVDGVCASAATFLSIVGKERLITPHSFMLIHQLSSSFWGKFNDFKDEVKNLDLFMKIIREIYNKHTKIPDKKLNEILNHDLFFDAKTCLKYGLVDKII